MAKSDIQSKVSKKLVPMMTKLGQVKILQALSGGMMMILPLTLGAAIFSLLGSFPIPSVAKYFASIGLSDQFNAISNGTMGVLAIFTTLAISYNYAKLLKTNPIIPALFSGATFFILQPQTIMVGKKSVQGFQLSNLGSSGIFVSMFIAILIPLLYAKLSKNKKLTLKMPGSVPPMVAESFEPIFIGIILLFMVFIVRFGFSITSYNDVFTFVTKIVAQPLMNVGASIPALFLVYVLANILFFFGIHPNAIMSVITPIILPMMMISIDQFNKGQTVHYLSNLIMFDFMNNDGTGSTLSLMLCIFLFGKSKRYRSFAKLGIIPNMFNINEPVIFGFPIMLNPIMFIPFVLSTVVSGFMGYIAMKIGFIATYNPNFSAVILPWTVPKFIGSFFTMGWQGVVMRLLIMVVIIFLYYPFFKVLDNQELKLEQKSNGAITNEK
ncbi:PTS sugar transporter subunit IIC [Companilactobacillus kimchii]|uniref:Permease IIC component n=2 Tax=Companilactobacillus kimchii TaxID=2801452 RepID=A0ABR5NUA2_9LACO|nr:PTS transporter subunit EIIC [Companilactobacillus kimchii]GEO48219.1 permease IIC component [Companilactobacillus paralimentarius]KAE9558224.1 PTS cellobiose transporter subunit IIC [Companilactobacillus kimchii]KAE9562434.1 PTS cellobiose transporter subunit IIC [Companilactobacillus kimchii]KRK52012.1 PTS system iic component [Companilactobacillus kimchii DSM 13961 = JCM 10707]OWF31972.1 Oligo-beta-mannoside permease IIC component [Companilactobacillus kimchii]